MRVLWVSLFILIADQVFKVWVKMTMFPGLSLPVIGEWLRLTFTENPGMAFGLTIGSKLALTWFTILATVLILVYLWYVREAPLGYRLSLAMILGGALGNLVDRVFYGVIYGYAPLFRGEVVDYFHVSVFRGVLDIPVIGPYYMDLFPIWNLADMTIVIGVVSIILFQGRFQRQMEAQLLAARPAVAAGASPVQDTAGSARS
jgi:signal peptidase II